MLLNNLVKLKVSKTVFIMFCNNIFKKYGTVGRNTQRHKKLKEKNTFNICGYGYIDYGNLILEIIKYDKLNIIIKLQTLYSVRRVLSMRLRLDCHFHKSPG